MESAELFHRRKKKGNIWSTIPFKLLWSTGINPDVPLLNLTSVHRTTIAYACSHFAMIYDYCSKKMLPLQGHRNAVRTMSLTANGKWLLTADFEEDCTVIVWDTETRIPIRSLFNPHGSDNMTAACISPNAKYIVTVGNETCQKVCFWLWTFGRDGPDASVELPELSWRIKQITFNEKCSKEFVLMSDRHVFYFFWDYSVPQYYRANFAKKHRRCGIFNSSCFNGDKRQVMIATSDGAVLVWSNVHCDNVNSSRHSCPTREKVHDLKLVPLQKCSITVILNHKSTIVTGNSAGRITFYDDYLRVLYWCQKPELDCIKSIHFELQSDLLGPISTGSEEEEEDVELGNEEDSNVRDSVSEFSQDDDARKGKTLSDEKSDNLDSVDVKIAEHFSDICVNIESTYNKLQTKKADEDPEKSSYVITTATIERTPLKIGNFFVSTSTGTIVHFKMQSLKCCYIERRKEAHVTALDAHPENNYLVTGDVLGQVRLYNYEKRHLVASRDIPTLLDYQDILEQQLRRNKIVHVTNTRINENLISISAVKYSPQCNMIVCAVENGMMWMLHPFTLDLIETIPYKHSCRAITRIVFPKCGSYMAYADEALTVGLFKRNEENKDYLWDFLGKIRSHTMPIKEILFIPGFVGATVPRFFSLGSDRILVEYDVTNSGPYPDPGLKIVQSATIEKYATPLCLTQYPPFSVETFLILSNSEWKYRLLNDTTMMIRGTFLGPTFGKPVQQMKIITQAKNLAYMVAITEKEIVLQLLPLDGNPHKVKAIIGHPRKITGMAIAADETMLFTIGYKDSCVLMWKIQYKAVDILARLGGKGLSPYYCLVDGGQNGWLMNEMKDLFYYAQILHQGENTIATRIITEKLSNRQIPNIMRAIGFYPTNEELENILSEVSYREYAETGKLQEEISFEDLIQLYVNHRPAFGISTNHIKDAFKTIGNLEKTKENEKDDYSVTRYEFLDILLGKYRGTRGKEDDRSIGEPLTFYEAYVYLKILLTKDELDEEQFEEKIAKRRSSLFDFLPPRISYKYFATDIMGIVPPDQTRANND